MIAFIDFEASSLAKRSYPIEVAWVFEDGREEAHLIHPEPDWIDWDAQAQAIHGIARETLLREGEPAARVAVRMVLALDGHELVASAPSWDGKWLGALLRAGNQPRHRIRLGSSSALRRRSAAELLARNLPPQEATQRAEVLVAALDAQQARAVPAHRALADAREERARWLAACEAARGLAGNAA